MAANDRRLILIASRSSGLPIALILCKLSSKTLISVSSSIEGSDDESSPFAVTVIGIAGANMCSLRYARLQRSQYLEIPGALMTRKVRLHRTVHLR